MVRSFYKPRPYGRILTTRPQRDAMKYLTARIAEAGYYIYPVARTYRRHYLDRLALRPTNPATFFIFRPARSGIIEFRPYDVPTLYPEIATLIKKLESRISTPLRFRRRQLPHIKGRGKVWTAYLTRGALRELALLAPREERRLSPFALV